MDFHLHAVPPYGPLPTAVSTVELIRVVLADDHLMMRHSLRLLLEGEGNIEVVAEADNHTSVALQVEELHPHVVVLDLRMDGASSIGTIQALSEHTPETQIVVLSMQDSAVFAQHALAAGAVGFVAKDRADEELPQAIRAAADGRQYVSPRVASGLEALNSALTINELTPREVEVLRLIALGHTSVEVAHKLALSPRTIETHRSHIHQKLGLTTRAELVDYSLRRGLIGT
jgi:two-component system response regulator NreC